MKYTAEQFYADMLAMGDWIQQSGGDLQRLASLQAKGFLKKYGTLDGVDLSARFNRLMRFAAQHNAELERHHLLDENGLMLPEFLDFLLAGFEDVDPGTDLILRRDATQLLNNAGRHRDDGDDERIDLRKVMRRWNARPCD